MLNRARRTAARALALVTLATLFPSYGSAAADLGPGAISAFVRDDDGKPVAGALVFADGPTTREATTSVAGIVTLLALPIGTYDVSVTRPGFAPLWRRVAVSSDPQASVLSLRIARATLARDGGNAVDVVSLDAVDGLGVGRTLAETPDASLVPVPGSASGAAATLLGTAANETRVELDGIPLAGGGASLAALRLRTAAGLDAIAFEQGPIVRSSTVRGAIGGIIDYRTEPLDGRSLAMGEAGYSSTFGAFQHLGTARTVGSLDARADIVAGGGVDRTQAFKARYALSRATSFDLSSYGLQSATTVRGTNVATIAPAFAAGVRTSLGRTSFAARAFSSSLSTSSALATSGFADDTERTRGVTASLGMPLGRGDLTVSFDRRSEYAAYLQPGVAHTAAQTFTTFGASGDLYVSRATRLQIGDEYSGGTNVAPRHDPQVAFEMHVADRVTIRAAVGRSFTTVPTAFVRAAGSATPLEPETAFGYRLSVDDTLGPADTARVSVFDLRRFDRFASYASARTSGLDVGFTHRPGLPGFGGSADATFARAHAAGALQPFGRRVDVQTARALAALEAEPSFRLHSSLRYQLRRGASLAVRSTLFGANNGFAPRSIGFLEASAGLPLADVAEVRLAENNILGTVVRDPLLEPYFIPREFTLIFRLGLRAERPGA